MRFLFRVLIVGAIALCMPRAQAVTGIGSNFDSIMSLIYDSTTGNVFIENAPQPNPFVQRISIGSASGLLAPLTLPATPSPPKTIFSNTPFLRDIGWPGGNFMGTGTSLGAILPFGLSQAFLLNDLTIQFGAGSMQPLPGDLIYDTFGTTQGNPVLPNSGGNGFWRFFNVGSGQFMDPPLANGFTYTIDAGMSPVGAAFTKIGFPTGLGSSFTVTSSQGVVSGIGESGEHTFGAGVSSFTVTGINPAVDAANSNAFPLYVEFSTSTASFSMQAIPVPEPTTLGLLCAVGLGVALRRRRLIAI